MRPSIMWGVRSNDALASNPIGVAIFETEGDAKRAATDASKQSRTILRPVKVFVKQYPSLMYRETTPTEFAAHDGAEFIIGD